MSIPRALLAILPRALPAALALAVVFVVAQPSRADPAASGRAQAADFSLTDLGGKRVKLSDFKGKVVVVDFWATWCLPCLQELPVLQAAYQELKDKGLVVLAISTDGPETTSRIRGVVRSKRLTMPVLHDSAGSVVATHNPRGANPYTIFIDRAGRIAEAHEGYVAGDAKKYRSLIDALLAER